MKKEAEEVQWTEALPFDSQGVESAPNGPGLIQLLHGHPSSIVWMEEALNVRSRLVEMRRPGWQVPAELARAFADVRRFRAAIVRDSALRARALARSGIGTPKARLD